MFVYSNKCILLIPLKTTWVTPAVLAQFLEVTSYKGFGIDLSHLKKKNIHNIHYDYYIGIG